MGWIKHYQFKGFIQKRHIGKVRYDVWVDFQISPITKNVFFVPNVSKQSQRVFFVKPKHPTATTGI